MVVFTCNHCGDSLQKPKVQKHYQTACSRNAVNITCVDCHKDFDESGYVAHTKCMTEAQRYSDKSYVAKVNKGEAKQSAWIDAVQSVINESSGRNPMVKEILHKISLYENVPRKKAKFMNFMKNCAVSRTKDSVLEEVWSLLEEKQKQMKESANQNEKESEKANEISETNNKRKLESDDCENNSKILKVEENGDTHDIDNTKPIEEEVTNGHNGDTIEDPAKFEWKKEIVDCLNSSNNEISMKSLRKKIVEKYLSTVKFDKYFMKKMKKIKGLTIENDVVKLEQ